MSEAVQALTTRHGVIIASKVSGRPVRRRQFDPIWVTCALSLAFLLGYSAFQRIGTRANADTIEYTENLAGGFLAVGISEQQPGFVVFSALDRAEVEVGAEQSINAIAGTYTTVHVKTPKTNWHQRLRSPMVVTVQADGTAHATVVDWSLDEFNALREGVDCAHVQSDRVLRCGAPFADLKDLFAKWPSQRVPEQVRTFVRRHATLESELQTGR